jgi:hypothetical protein
MEATKNAAAIQAGVGLKFTGLKFRLHLDSIDSMRSGWWFQHPSEKY